MGKVQLGKWIAQLDCADVCVLVIAAEGKPAMGRLLHTLALQIGVSASQWYIADGGEHICHFNTGQLEYRLRVRPGRPNAEWDQVRLLAMLAKQSTNIGL